MQSVNGFGSLSVSVACGPLACAPAFDRDRIACVTAGGEILLRRKGEGLDALAGVEHRAVAGQQVVDDAVQIALFNNRGLRAALHELGISQADWVQATYITPDTQAISARATLLPTVSIM